jgi:hypothetical protein
MLDRLKISARVFYDELTSSRVTLGRALYFSQTKLGDGLRTAYYRDIVRPWILATPPFEQTDDILHEIHVLTSIDDWLNLLWALKTFYYWSGRRYALCIHDDGTLTPTACGHLRTAFPKARIIGRSESDKRLEPMLADFPRSREFRATNKLSLKVFDFQVYLEAERLVLLDSDILFFGSPSGLLALISDPATTFNTLNKDWRHGYSFETEQVQPLLDFTLPPLINAGLGLIHRGSAPFDWVEEFLVLPGIMSQAHQIEQTLTALCSARFGFQMLPEEYDVHMGPRRPGAPCRHYTGPIRHMMYDEGIRELVRNGFFEALRQQHSRVQASRSDPLVSR